MAALGSPTHLPTSSHPCSVNKPNELIDSPGFSSLESNCGLLLEPYRERVDIVHISLGKTFSQQMLTSIPVSCNWAISVGKHQSLLRNIIAQNKMALDLNGVMSQWTASTKTRVWIPRTDVKKPNVVKHKFVITVSALTERWWWRQEDHQKITS